MNNTDATALPKRVEVVVIGGGIVGASAAYFLSEARVPVALCEKGAVGGEQSSRNWGFVRKQGRDPAELPLMIASDALWSGLEKNLQHDLGFVRAGVLYPSRNQREQRKHLAWLEHARAFNLDTKYLTARELSALSPAMQHDCVGALYTPSDARAEPAVVSKAIAAAVVARGGTVLERCAVRAVDVEGGRAVGVVTERGRIAASAVVCAGGAWSSYFCRNLGVTVPQLKVRGSVLATVPAATVTTPSLWTRDLGLRRRADGGYTVAAGSRSDFFITPDGVRFFTKFIRAAVTGKEQVRVKLRRDFWGEWGWPSRWSAADVSVFEKIRTLNPPPNEKLLARAHRSLGKMFPALEGVGVAQRWAGMIDVTPDELPVISEVAAVPGFTLATGFSGHGFGIGPAAGKATAELVTGDPTIADLSAFSLSRFA